MFFSPFVTHFLKNNTLKDINQEDRQFVFGYVSLGYITLILLGLSLLTWGLSYFTQISLFWNIYYIIVGILILFLIIWSIGVLTETKIFLHWSDTNILATNKLQVILSYLPGYSVYLRYTNHSFDSPNIFLKESLILWTLLGIAWCIPFSIFVLIMLSIILIRITTLLWNINIIPNKLSEFLSWLFYKNPEEIRAYIWGTIVFIFHGNYNIPYWKLLIENIKKEYQYLYDIKKFWTIQRQLLLLLVWSVLLLWQVDVGYISGLVIIPLILLRIRYIIMIYFWWRSPALPLFREIISLFDKIFTPFIPKK